MPSFFDDDSDEEMASIPRQQPRPQGQSAINRASSSRQPSVISESSRAESSRPQSHRQSFADRLISASPSRSDKISESLQFGEDVSMSSMNATSNFGYPSAGQRHKGKNVMERNRLMDDGDGISEMDMSDRSTVRMLDDHDDGVMGDDDLLEGDLDDVKRLGRVWVKERGTNQIMQWEGDLMDNLFDKLEQQQKMVDTLRSDPQTSEEEHFKLVLVMTEMERVKYLIRSYVRTRLSKIEKYSQHIIVAPELHPLLSGAELSHARRYTELLHTHFQHSVLDSLPEWLRKMDDQYNDGTSMISKPDPNVPVLIYCRRDCGQIQLPSGEQADLGKGSTHLVKYNLVEQWVKLGWAEVI